MKQSVVIWLNGRINLGYCDTRNLRIFDTLPIWFYTKDVLAGRQSAQQICSE